MKFVTTLLLLSYSLVVSGQPAFIETYYVPMPDIDLFNDVFKVLSPTETGPDITTISIAVGSAGTIIYYSHWEDGYKTPEIWGDGNLTNGVLPGYPSDVFATGGRAIVLSNRCPREPQRTNKAIRRS
jgi:hypothetical protein